MAFRVGILDGEEAHVVSLPFLPHRGMILLFTSAASKEQIKFKVSDVAYDCDLGEVMLEGEVLKT